MFLLGKAQAHGFKPSSKGSPSLPQKTSQGLEKLSACCCPEIHKGVLDQASAAGPMWIKAALAAKEYFSNWVTTHDYPMNLIWCMINPFKKIKWNIKYLRTLHTVRVSNVLGNLFQSQAVMQYVFLNMGH